MRRSRRWIASNIVTATLCVCVRACVCACVFKDIQFLWEHFSTTALCCVHYTNIPLQHTYTQTRGELHTHTQSIKTIVLLRSHADMIWEHC